jgi:seryl-tRNA synthetase
LRARLEELEALGRQVEAQLDEMRSWIPNLPGAGVPEGADGSANVVLHEHGRQARFDFPPLPHYELGVKLGILDCARGGKTSGSGWYFLRGDGSRLERALISWFLDRHRARGYTELFPPFCVTEKALFGSGQIPKLRDEMYAMPRDGLFAIPTAEVPVTNYHADEILDEEDLPIRYCAYSACFRREAGAAGAETRGILRVHQFNKVEILKLTTPETSYAELEKLTRDAEELLEGCATAAWSCAAAIWVSTPPRLTTWKPGRRPRASGWRCRVAATSPTTRRAGPTSATGRRPAASRASCTRSTVPAWRCRVSRWPSGKPFSSPTARS